MLNFKGMRFPIDVILVCIRWYVAYPLSYRHLEEMMEKGSVALAKNITACSVSLHFQTTCRRQMRL